MRRAPWPPGCCRSSSRTRGRRQRSRPPASLVDERDRAVLHLAGRIALGVDVRDLLQLQRALERDRIVDAAAEVEEVAPLRTLWRSPRSAARTSASARCSSGSCVSASSCGRAASGVERAAHLAEVDRQQVQRDQLRRERLRRRDADLRAGVGVDRAVGSRVAMLPTTLQMAMLRAPASWPRAAPPERIGRLARLRDHDRERVLVDDRIAIAELRPVVDLHRHPRQRSIRNLPTRPACHDVPHARITTRSIAAQPSEICISSRKTVPDSTDARPSTVS